MPIRREAGAHLQCRWRVDEGLWLPVADENSAERFENAIERDGRFTTVVSASEIRPKLAELCLVFLQNRE